ncbi:MAG: HD-GYP domain-containing protein [Gammaproteobacteria bacterium]|nr:HD-GYP domain-containing protein [Gammaproteobacteria bacterium]
MIKKIKTSDLKVGMYIHDLNSSWMEHSFISNQFKIKADKDIKKMHSHGIKSVYIDTQKGLDFKHAPTAADTLMDVHKKAINVAGIEKPISKQTRVGEEIQQARSIYKAATKAMNNIMTDARLGKQVQVELVQPIAEQMIESAFRNKDALISLSRIKSKDEYTFMHSVSVAGLMVSFGRAMDMDKKVIHEIAVGGLLHDIGKMSIPLEILNKPGKHTPSEWEIMKSHVVHSREILKQTPGISQQALDVGALHHERYDGSGYPDGLKHDQISEIGQMSAIVDVYDALTSIRVYKDAWEPTITLKKMLEWSPHHFNPELIQRYIRSLGIYPIGTLVELESGLVGVVIEQGEGSLLQPMLRIFYNAKKTSYVKIREMDLTRETSDRILNAVSPSKYGIDLSIFY